MPPRLWGAPRPAAGLAGPQRRTAMDADRRPCPHLPRRLPWPWPARAATSASPSSPSPTSGDAASVVLPYHLEVNGASPAAPSRLPIRTSSRRRARKRRDRPFLPATAATSSIGCRDPPAVVCNPRQPRLRKAATPLGCITLARDLPPPPPGRVTPASRTICPDVRRLVATHARRLRCRRLLKTDCAPYTAPCSRLFGSV